MKILVAITLTAFLAVPAIAKHRTVEFHLLDDEPAAGLQPVEVTPKTVKYMHPEAVLLESDIAKASALEQPYGGREVEITFTHEGAAKLERVTSANVGKCLAVVIDGKVILAPRIMSAMTTGVAQLSVAPGDSIEKIVVPCNRCRPARARATLAGARRRSAGRAGSGTLPRR